MDDAALVRRGKRIGQWDRQTEERVDRQAALGDHLGERRALDHLHGDKANTVHLVHRMNSDDVGVVQSGDRPGLPLKAHQPLGIESERLGEDLERNVAAELRIPRSPHLAHPPSAERREDLIRTEADAGCKTHWRGILGESITTVKEPSLSIRSKATARHPTETMTTIDPRPEG